MLVDPNLASAFVLVFRQIRGTLKQTLAERECHQIESNQSLLNDRLIMRFHSCLCVCGSWKQGRAAVGTALTSRICLERQSDTGGMKCTPDSRFVWGIMLTPDQKGGIYGYHSGIGSFTWRAFKWRADRTPTLIIVCLVYQGTSLCMKGAPIQVVQVYP